MDTPAGEAKGSSYRALIWVAVILCVVLIAFVVFAATTGKSATIQLPQDQQLVPISATTSAVASSGSTEPLKGYFFISGAFDMTTSLLNTYAIGANDARVIGIGGTPDSVGNMYSFTGDGKTAVFIGTTKQFLQQFQTGARPAGGVRQVYYEQLSEGGFPTPNTATQLTDNTVPNKQMPAISDDGSRVVYVSASTSVPQVGASTIHLVTAAGDKALFAGTDPQWFSANGFYYVAPDGIRLFDVAASSSALVLPIDGQSNFRIAVSPDRTRLAFSDPDGNVVSFFAIGSGGMTLRPLETLPMRGFWVVFSPDSRYAAVQTLNMQDGQPLLDIFAVGDFTQVRTIHLGSFLNDRLFVTAWLY